MLYRALGQAGEALPGDLTGAVRLLPAVGEMPSPWETWALVGLVRHRRRQLWVGEVITTRLSGNLLDLARLMALGHPQGVPQSGTVPGLPEWEYYFHGKGCCLTHKVTGEEIDVDFFDDSAEYFDLFFYENYLKSLRSPEPAEGRLLELHGSIKPISLAVEGLLEAGALAPLPGRDAHPFRVTGTVLRHEGDLAAFCAGWADPARRPWLAALVGDWPAAHEAALRAGDQALVGLTASRVDRCRQLRRHRLLQPGRKESHASAALLGLADLGAAELPGSLVEALRGSPSGVTSTALEVIVKQDDPAWCPEVYGLFRRMNPDHQPPEPHIWMESLKFLLRHGHRREEMQAALPRAGGSETGEAFLLAQEHAPEQALPLVRRALRSGVPASRCAVAAILALIDRPWSRRELIAVLEESDDQEQTADCRAALLECRDEAAHRVVRAWQERNPHEPEAGTFLEIEGRQFGPFISMAEVSLRNRGEWLRYEMEKLHDRVMAVRDRVPR
jgi:hypothetical protein